MKKTKKNAGFTFLEMIAVVAVIGILSASTVPLYKQLYGENEQQKVSVPKPIS